MSRIYDALKKLEAESQKASGATGNGSTNGKNGGGNGHGRRGWRPWPFGRNAGKPRPAPSAIDFNLGPEVEEAYQRLGTNLLLAPGQLEAAHPRLLGIVASRHGEGTTTTAGVFASILVRRRGGRVVVVEGNLHSPSFGVKPSPGLVDLIQGQATVAEAAQATSIPKLFAIAGGHSTVTAASLFDSPGLPAAFAHLREQFDFAIVDLPPVNVYGDALIVGPHLDAAVIVIEADATRVSDVERARRTLERAGVRFVGSVLNRQRSYIPAFIEEML
jgi:capsular exopolysaccharide synthesis family protein